MRSLLQWHGETTLIEMGSGSASKTRLIIEALLQETAELAFHSG